MSDWETKNLADLLDRPLAYGVLKPGPYEEGGIPLVRIQDHKDGEIKSNSLHKIPIALHHEFKRTELRDGDIIISVVGTIGRTAIIPKHLTGANVSRAFAVIGCSDEIDKHFLDQYLKSDISQSWFKEQCQGNAQQVLNLGTLREYPVPIPPLPEQKKIAEILSGIDHALQKLQERVAKSRDLAKSVSCELISGRISSSGYKMSEHGRIPADWEIKELDDCLDLYNCQSQTDGEYEVLTSASKGLMRQSEYHGANRITQRDSTGFNIIPSGYITYRSRSDSNSFYFNLNKLGITGLVSKYYPVFRPKSGMQASDFFCLLLNHYSPLLSRESVGTSQVVLSFNALKKVALPIPPLAEQLKISTAIASLKEMIKREEAKVATLIELKASISSDLLSGHKRVSV